MRRSFSEKSTYFDWNLGKWDIIRLQEFVDQNMFVSVIHEVPATKTETKTAFNVVFWFQSEQLLDFSSPGTDRRKKNISTDSLQLKKESYC